MRYNKTRIIEAGKELLTAYVEVKKGNNKAAFAAFKAAMADKNIDVLMEGVAVAVAELEEDYASPDVEDMEDDNDMEDMEDMSAEVDEDYMEDDEDMMDEDDLSDMEDDEEGSIEVTETVAKVLNLKY